MIYAEDDDEQPNVACTSQLQKWHKKVVVTKSQLNRSWKLLFQKLNLMKSKSGEGLNVCCMMQDVTPRMMLRLKLKFKNALKDLNPGMGLSIMAGDDSFINSFVGVKVGSSQVGSFCSYLLAHTEANFAATVDISAVPRGDDVTTELTKGISLKELLLMLLTGHL